MESKVERKEAIRKFKERKPARGTYALRSAATGRIWVGSSPNLDATRNGSWFSLRNGSHRDQALQDEWTTHGETAFQFEVLEKLDDDLSPMEVADRLKEERLHWIALLKALPLY